MARKINCDCQAMNPKQKSNMDTDGSGNSQGKSKKPFSIKSNNHRLLFYVSKSNCAKLFRYLEALNFPLFKVLSKVLAISSFLSSFQYHPLFSSKVGLQLGDACIQIEQVSLINCIFKQASLALKHGNLLNSNHLNSQNFL